MAEVELTKTTVPEAVAHTYNGSHEYTEGEVAAFSLPAVPEGKVWNATLYISIMETDAQYNNNLIFPPKKGEERSTLI